MHLARCGKAEASSIDAVTYSRITDMAAMYSVLAAIRMHRPTPTFHYDFDDEISKTHNSEKWRLSRHYTEINKIIDDPRHFSFGTALGNLEIFRMPTGKKTQDWLHRADRAVSLQSPVAVRREDCLSKR